MATVNIGEILTTTLQYAAPDWADSLSDNNVLYYKLKQNDRIIKIAGGYDIRVPLMYPGTSQGKWIDGYDELNISPQDGLDSCQYQWKTYMIPVVISGTDKRKNSGSKTQLKHLLKSRVEVAKKTMMNDLDEALFSDGTANGGKQIGGLQALFSTTATASQTGTVGGISRTNFSWWRNEVRASSPARTAGSIKQELNVLMTAMSRGTDKVDLGLLNNTDYNLLLEATQAIQQISSSKLAEVGFDAIRYRGADMALAGGSGGHIPSTFNYLLNTNYIALYAHQDLFMSPVEPEERSPVNQDAVVKHMGLMGNLVVSNMQNGGAVLL
jgi:hypothetical protein